MRFTKKFVCDFIQHSNLIEDIDHPRKKIEEVYDMIKKPKVKLNRDFLNAFIEVTNTIEAIEYVKAKKFDTPTIHDVRELHQITMKGLLHDAGNYRSVSVMVGGDVCPHPGKVLQMMNILMQRWDDELTVTFPKPYDKEGIVIPGNDRLGYKTEILEPKKYTSEYIRHCEFETIHPFSDGNGRTGRLLYLWDCLYHGKKFKVINIDRRYVYYATIKLYKSLLKSTLDIKKPKGE
jgi:Fic family protein